MNNKFKDIRMKSHTFYFFNDVINIKKFDPNDIKIDERHTKIFLFTSFDM